MFNNCPLLLTIFQIFLLNSSCHCLAIWIFYSANCLLIFFPQFSIQCPKFFLLMHRNFLYILDQGWTNYSLQAESCSPPIFVNKVLLEHSHIRSAVCLWLLSCYNSRVEQLQQRPPGPQNLKSLLINYLQNNPYSRYLSLVHFRYCKYFFPVHCPSISFIYQVLC